MADLGFITSRRSDPVLVEPGPSASELDLMLQAAATAPDHRMLRPWRFFVIAGEARHELGDALAEAMAQVVAREPEAHRRGAVDRERTKPLRSPTIVATAAVRQPGSVPWWEQVASTAAATQNLLLAANALGYGSIWRTGGLLEHPVLLDAFGLRRSDRLVALVHLGSRRGARPRGRAGAATESTAYQWSGRRQWSPWRPSPVVR